MHRPVWIALAALLLAASSLVVLAALGLYAVVLFGLAVNFGYVSGRHTLPPVTLAFGAAKRLIALSPESSLETQMEHERRAIAACGGTEDFSEGVAAFVEKRPPKFSGK